MLGMIARGLWKSVEGLQTKKKLRTVHVVCAISHVMKFQHQVRRSAPATLVSGLLVFALFACSSDASNPDAVPASTQPSSTDTAPNTADVEEPVGEAGNSDNSSDSAESLGSNDVSEANGSEDETPGGDESVGDDESQPEEIPSPEFFFAEEVAGSFSISEVVETQCGLVAAAITGNDTHLVDGDSAEAVVVHDLRWDGEQWTSQQQEIIPAWERSNLSYNPLEVRAGIDLHHGENLSSGVRLIMTSVWEEGFFSYVEHLDANCEWVPSDVALPCGVVNHMTRASIEPGAFVNAYQPNWSPEGDLDQPNCYSQEDHALVWHPDIGMFQALPVSGGCPDGYVDEMLPDIRMCERGDGIEYLQRNGLYFEPEEVDGFFGPATQRALIALQQSLGADNDFGIEVNGIYDDPLQNALYSGWGDY